MAKVMIYPEPEKAGLQVEEMTAKKKILIVEDEAIISLKLKHDIETWGYGITGIVSKGEEVVSHVESEAPDLILMDIELSGEIDGVHAAELVTQQYNIPILFLTSYDDETTMRRVKQQSPYAYISKPYNPRMLSMSIYLSLYKAQMNNALKESEQFGKAILNSLTAALVVVDKEGCIKTSNSIFLKEMSKLDVQNETNSFFSLFKTIFSTGKNERDEYIIFEIKQVLRTRKASFVIEYKCNPALLYRWIALSVSRLQEKSGYGVITITNVSERKKIEESLQKMSTLVQASGDAIIGLDKRGIVTVWNTGAERMYGYVTKEAMNRPISDLIQQRESLHYKAIIDDVLKNQKSVTFETNHNSRNGTEIDVSVTISPILGSEDRSIGAAMIVKGITELRSVERSFFQTSEDRINIFSQYLQENLVQALTGLVFQITSLEETLVNNDSKINNEVRRIKNSLVGSINLLRDFLQNMAVVELESQTIECIIEAMVAMLKRLTRFEIVYFNSGEEIVIEYYLKLHLYRFLQEALLWVINRDDLNQIEIYLKSIEDDILLSVTYHVSNEELFIKELKNNSAYQLMKYRAQLLRALFSLTCNTRNTIIISLQVRK